MKNLTSEDKGIYHCASEGGRVHSSFNLTVKEGDCSDLPIAISAHEGENINVTCKCPFYKSTICTNTKHFSKEHKTFIESGLIDQKSSSVKYSLTEKPNANTFNVTIHKLEMKDAGMYWCGFQTGGENIALTAQVNLHITGRLEEVRGVVGGGVAIVCKFDDQDQLNQKQRFFCKGNASTCPYHGLSSTDNNRVALYR
ncbi:polymeric immunoglobulin receptor-like [Engraulis encrasicolus]|uniref:polymeric immunoglobulin receptor-like n=1 Tax=Engraulis encrasicolus TaxID=184585 RepID=UPI002FD68063